MIKIIKEGKKEFEGTCDLCGTIFTYELSDVVTYGDTNPYVKCPVCEKRYYHYINGVNRLNLDENQIYPYKSYFDDELGVWVNPCINHQKSTDPYEKIPYWMRPDYKAPEVTCKGTTDHCSSDSSNFDYSTVSTHNTLGSMTLETDSLSNS